VRRSKDLAKMGPSYSFTSASHAAFGALAALAIPGQPVRRFTQQEALILSRALAAVAQGASAERHIYMSPIASDCDFDAQVAENGLLITAPSCPDAALNWQESNMLAGQLAHFGGVAP
jgi:hypothetical protein